MERWAANTLRTLGIILTAGFVLVTSLFLVLLSICSSQGGFGGNRQPDQAALYAILAVVVVIAGVAFITWLARGIYRSSKMAPDAASDNPATQPQVPPHLSPLGRQAINRLATALAAQIVVSAAVLIFNQIRFWSGPRIFAPFPQQRWILLLFVPFVLYHIPYAILIFALLKRPDRRAFAYSLAVPAVLIMQALLSLGYLGLFLNRPFAFLLLFIPWAIHIAIIVLAYRAIQQVGIHPPPSSLIAAAAVTLVYFLVLHASTPIFYRAFAR